MANDNDIVVINGREYDKNTGLPISNSSSKPLKTTDTNSKSTKIVHSIANRSKALYSHAAQKTFNDIRTPKQKINRNMDITKSKHISRFASVTSSSSIKTDKNMDVKPTPHPIAARVEKLRSNAKNNTVISDLRKSTKTIKQEAITEALNKSSTPVSPKNSFIKRNRKYINIFTISAVLLLVSGYFIYLNMPSISVRVASIQAGINATYPEYHPDGYSVNGPVSYSDGEVTINFHANTGSSSFVIKQSKSSWDSSALKIQIDKDSNNETSESQEGGLTIYTYDDNTRAAWVNGGILYSITGDAKLSGNQIRRIATSL